MSNIQNQLSFIVISILLSVGTAVSANEYAVAGYVKGKVSLLSVGDTAKLWKIVKQNDVIKPGDTIKTGNGSKIDLVFKETEFRIQPNSSFTLKEWDPKSQVSKVYLENGAAWFKVKNFQKGKFEVTTPMATAGVRGTAFGVYYEVKEKRTYTCVCEGKVDVNGTVFSQGTGGVVDESASLEKSEYKELFEKGESGKPGKANLNFQKKMKEAPMLAKCLPCHQTSGWEAKDVLADEKYGK
ncbi:FecR family protein [Leptospira idonii]|uniref:Iron dicitrate transport regulator FecR n=1 Tax=Leptospira idonii TaxID=1193500 RepID=A0A4R9LYN8_9LEPT|nr:FecR family protein [Leptospira idonii]TGN17090.1 iron dicitrate transport regulator FecR [Leptospira idonii]